MRILVTGAGGYIGRHLIPRLRDEGHEVWGLYRTPPSFQGTRHDRWGAELTNLPEFVFGGLPVPDTVIHLAGRVEINLLPNPKGDHLPPIPGPCDIGALYRDNVLATANVLQYCLQAGVKHLIFASTQAVYGMEEEECQECGNPAQTPLEYYAASKLAAERLLGIGREQGATVGILRLPGIYGGDRRNGAVYTMCRDALAKGEIHVTHPYPVAVNVMHIEDVVGAIAVATRWTPPNEHWRDGYTLDVADGEPCSLDILAAEIASLVPGCQVLSKSVRHPTLKIERMPPWYGWYPKPRKERLVQVLEEIRRER